MARQPTSGPDRIPELTRLVAGSCHEDSPLHQAFGGGLSLWLALSGVRYDADDASMLVRGELLVDWRLYLDNS